MPGVLDILTHAAVGEQVRRVARVFAGGYAADTWRPLSSAELAHWRQPVALVVGETAEQAPGPSGTRRSLEMTQREAVFPAGRHDVYTNQTYSAAIRSGGLLFVSGQVGSRSDGSPEPAFEAQVRLALANVGATLKAGGCSFDDIVDVTSFHTDSERQFGAIMAIKGEVFPKPPFPNWTAVSVNWLAGFDFAIKVIARIP